MIILIVISLILFLIGGIALGGIICGGEDNPIYTLGAIPLGVGVLLLIYTFIQYKQTDVSICVSDNIKTVEEIKTNDKTVQYDITLKDGTKFTVKPIEEENN